MIEFKNNIGQSSYCIIDKQNKSLPKYIKYFFENKINNTYNEVIKDNIIYLKNLNEIRMNEIISNLSIPKPKYYSSEKLPNSSINKQIFNKIPNHINYNFENIQMYKLVLEYLPYPTLFEYFNKNGLQSTLNNNKETITNNINTNDMIIIYKQIFQVILTFIKNNIIPYDLENVSNFLIDKDKKYM